MPSRRSLICLLVGLLAADPALARDASVEAEPVTLPINSGFTQLVKNVKMGGFISFTAEKNRWGVNADFQYINLYGENSAQSDNSLDLKNVIGEIDLLYRPEATYQLMALFRWGVGKSLSIPFGYRVLGYQIRKDEVLMNTRMNGLVVG